MNEISPLVSVIVTTRNSEETLESCLNGIRTQLHRRVELIVIDNNSTDGTARIAGRHSDVVETFGPERSAQRNRGARLAHGDFFLFLDSDMVLQPPIVQECLAQAERGARAVIVPEVSVGTGYWTACKALERSCYAGDQTIEGPRFIERLLFEELAGFDEHLTGPEDWDLAVRIRESGATLGRTQTPMVHHEGRLTLGETMRSKYYYGQTMPRYMRKHPEIARSQLKLFRPAFLRRRDLLMRRPWLTVGMLFMKTCEIVAGGTGALIAWRSISPALGPRSQPRP